LPIALKIWKWVYPSEVLRLMKPSKEELKRDPKFWESWKGDNLSTNPLTLNGINDSDTSLTNSNYMKKGPKDFDEKDKESDISKL